MWTYIPWCGSWYHSHISIIAFTVRRCRTICGIIVQLFGEWWIMIYGVDETCRSICRWFQISFDIFDWVMLMMEKRGDGIDLGKSIFMDANSSFVIWISCNIQIVFSFIIISVWNLQALYIKKIAWVHVLWKTT